VLQNNTFQKNNSENNYQRLKGPLILLVCKNTGGRNPKLTTCCAIKLLFHKQQFVYKNILPP